jgi:CheY-like chemotaxis protein
VAEDDDSVRSLIVKVLQQLGMGVLVADDGLAAVRLVLEHRALLSCAILDMRMPLLDGLEAARAIRKIAPDLAIVMMSAHFPTDYRQQLAPLRIDHVLEKPFHLSELRGMVHRFNPAALPMGHPGAGG